MSLSPEEERVRFALYNQRLNDTTIAKVLGRPRETIYSWRRRRGLSAYPKPSKLDPLREEILELYNDGFTETKIAERLGLAQVTLSKWLRDKGFPPKRPRNRYSEPWELAEVEKAYLAGVIDSDGHISLGSKPQYRQIGVTNTDK